MSDKQTLLNSIADGLKHGTITERDIQSVLRSSKPAASRSTSKSRLSAVDIMFYIVGIVLFTGVAVLIGQSWSSGPGVRIFLSAGTGIALWMYAFSLLKSKKQDDIRHGLSNALLLCGSLLLIAGSFIIANEIVSFEEYHFFIGAIILLLMGSVHISFGLQIKRKLTLLTGILLAVAAFPSAAFGLLEDSNAPMYVYTLITAISGGLLAYAARVTGRISVNSKDIMRTFDLPGAFIILISLYAASFSGGAIGLLWLLVLVAGIIGLFYLSIVMQDKFMLGTGSFFLVLSVITVSFRYFSGYGAAASLFVSAAGLLATAIIATTINRRYLKEV